MKPLPVGLRPESLLRAIVSHPWRVILCVAVITAFFAVKIPSLRFETSIYDLILEDLPETAQYHAFKKAFGCEEIILVAAKAHDVFEPQTFSRIEALARTLSKIPGVSQVVSLPGIKKAMDITEKWDLEAFRDIIRPVTLFERNIVSRDGRTTVISLVLEDVRVKDRVISAVAEAMDREKGFSSLYQIGMPVVSKALTDFTERDFMTLPAMTFGIIVLILFVLFRSFRGILIPAGTVLICLVWTFGMMAWTETPLSLLTMIVPIFLIAVGTAYCNYVFAEYQSALEGARTPQEATFRCFQGIAFPTTLAVATTIIGLGSLLINRISAIQEFAAFSCFGILSMLLLVLTLLPSVMALLPFPRTSRPKGGIRSGGFERILSRLLDLSLNHQRWTFTAMGLVALAGALGLLRLEVETNPVGFFKEHTEIARNFRDIYRDMAGSFPVNVVVDSREESSFEDPANLRRILELQAFLEGLPGVDKTLSFVDYLKLVNYATNRYEEKAYVLPEEAFEIRLLVNSFKTMLGEDMLRRFVDGSFSRTNVLLRTHIASSKDFLALRDRIRTYLSEHFPRSFTFEVTGIGIVISQSSDLITMGQINSLFTSLGLIFVIMFLLFLSYKVGVVGMVPNLFPILVCFGLMGWTGIPLSMETSLIASIAIGLAMDDTLHYLVYYNQEFKRDLDKKRALKTTSLHMGRPIVCTTITICLGFSVLMLSHFKPTAVFGFLMVVTMFAALIGDLLLLPSLLLHVELVTLWDLLKLKLGRDPQKNLPLFKGMSRNQVHYVLMAGVLRVVEAGRVIFRKGEMSDSMYAIISGELQVVEERCAQGREGEAPLRQVIATLRQGDSVGEMGMFRACERSATVVAAEDTELIRINVRMIRRLQWLYPPAGQKFFINLLNMVCDRLQAITDAFLQQAPTDRLSGLHTREFFLPLLVREIQRAVRFRTPLSLIVLGPLHFSDFVKEHGYKAGDALLGEVGARLREALAPWDIPCRIEGELFAALLPHTEPEEARARCLRLEALLTEGPYTAGNSCVILRMRFSFASLDLESPQEAERLLQQALGGLAREEAREFEEA